MDVFVYKQAVNWAPLLYIIADKTLPTCKKTWSKMSIYEIIIQTYGSLSLLYDYMVILWEFNL